MKNKKIAVLGGSFNPPTTAHLKLLQAAMLAIEVDKGIFLPAPEVYVRRKLAKVGYKKKPSPTMCGCGCLWLCQRVTLV